MGYDMTAIREQQLNCENCNGLTFYIDNEAAIAHGIPCTRVFCAKCHTSYTLYWHEREVEEK